MEGEVTREVKWKNGYSKLMYVGLDIDSFVQVPQYYLNMTYFISFVGVII